MKAINHFIIIDKIKEAPKTVGGLEITQNQNHDVRYLKGNIISVGDKIDFLKEGDVVGQLLRVLSTDQGSVRDFQAFAKQTGNEMVEMDGNGPDYAFVLKRR